MATKDRKAELVKAYEAKIEEISKACAKGTNAEVEGKLAELANIEKEYKSIYEKEVFASCVDVHEVLVKHHFMTISHKKLMDDGRMVGVEATEKMVVIDLKKYCEYKSLPLDWYYELQALNKRLALRTGEALGVSAKEMTTIDNSYAMDNMAKQIELGKTPTSDTQITKHMQRVLDLLSADEGRVNGHDLAYVDRCYCKRSNRAALKVQCSRHALLMVLLTDVFHRIVTGGVYSLEYKQARDYTEAPKTEAKPKASKPKAKAKDSGDTVVAKKGSPAA